MDDGACKPSRGWARQGKRSVATPPASRRRVSEPVAETAGASSVGPASRGAATPHYPSVGPPVPSPHSRPFLDAPFLPGLQGSTILNLVRGVNLIGWKFPEWNHSLAGEFCNRQCVNGHWTLVQ